MQAMVPHALAVCLVAAARAQEPAPPAAPAPSPWELSANVFYSDPPGSDDRTTAVLTADRGALHLEGRYNYEDLDTAALFIGWTFSVGSDAVSADLTPMLGGVLGDTDGIAPGLELDLGWKRLAWYLESEYLFDLDDSDDNFFYSWSTLTWGFTDWLRAGLVTERSKLVETDYEVQYGLALELAFKRLGLALYAYDLGTDDSYAVAALSAGS
jgi:hypothetical protein